MQINTHRAVLIKVTDYITARSAVADRKWIVGSISSQGLFSISALPVTHPNAGSALAECERLAKQNPGTTYITLQLQGGRVLPQVVNTQAF